MCHLRWRGCFILYSGSARFIWAVATRGGSLPAWCTPSHLLQATCKGLMLVNDLTLQQVRDATSRMESSLTHMCFALLEGEECRNDSQQAGSCSYTRAKPRDCVSDCVTVFTPVSVIWSVYLGEPSLRTPALCHLFSRNASSSFLSLWGEGGSSGKGAGCLIGNGNL